MPAGRLHPALTDHDEILISHACASGGLALAVGASLVDSGAVEQALVVAAMRPRFIEAAAFQSSGALSEQPYCRPFDHDADGTALGGFTGAVLLGAADAGPQIAGIGIRTLGSGAQSDRASQRVCMTDAIDMAGVAPQFVAAHATGTVHGDRVELDAVSDIGRDIGTRLPVSSCKGSIGHAVHAAGLATALYALEAMAADVLPGTARCTRPLEADHAEVVTAQHAVEGRGLDVGLVNAFGFGGSSCSLVLRWDRTA
ncbi:beta-ketoacyl synthase N-terminal-like domain-containing protein [Rhodococcus sp. (in: high G+C Gram-positive bacteria)]|uniref:beta-ketoacyl synthase N-terminal-like domain-containing protein n=1 Tax=Rhodococcus sp. TaxID=1831 RepID=UPI003B8A6C56